MSVHIWKASSELDSGRRADGYCLYIELFGFSLEITVARGR
jgi:hypothetical protein